jgi:hypothetical protein
MDVEGHKCGQYRVYQQKGKSNMDKEITKVRERIEHLAFQM